MSKLDPSQRFWIAVLVVGGFILFGAASSFIAIADGATIFVNTVLSTMGPLVGWVVKGLFDGGEPTGQQGDPVHVEQER